MQREKERSDMSFAPDRVINDNAVDWDKLRGSSVLITGGTGLVGSVLARTLLYANKKTGADIRITLAVRNMDKARRLYGGAAGVTLIQYDLASPGAEASLSPSPAYPGIEGPFDYIIHCAAVTSSAMMVNSPVETIELAYNGSSTMLRTARDNNVKGMVYISSMEVYGQTDESMNPVTEEQLGYVDLRNVRSSYQESKRICELLCTSYASEYGVRVVSARLAQTFGAGVSPEEGRVFAQFARSIIEGRDIVLHTDGMSVGNYCATEDMAAAVLILLTRGVPGEAYNVANEDNSRTICEMAQLCAEKIAEGRIGVVFDIPEKSSFGYAPPTKLRLSSAKLRGLGWEPQYTLEDMYRAMITYWDSCAAEAVGEGDGDCVRAAEDS